jgi:hypothetical protein
MALEDRIRTSVDAALNQIGAHIEDDVRALIGKIDQAAAAERAHAVAAARQAATDEVHADTRRKIEEAEARAGDARIREREAAIAALARLLESVRTLDAATSLSEVLDALGAAAGREASRAAVLVLRNDRLHGWKLSGFGARDAQPKAVDLGLTESGVLGLAVGAGRPATTRDSQTAALGPGFAHLPSDRMGFAVPVIVGGRVVAVVYGDSAADSTEHVVPSGWPEIIELLARHAARCLEALTAQKAAAASSPRFWVSGSAQAPQSAESQSSSASGPSASSRSGAPPGMNA